MKTHYTLADRTDLLGYRRPGDTGRALQSTSRDPTKNLR